MSLTGRTAAGTRPSAADITSESEEDPGSPHGHQNGGLHHNPGGSKMTGQERSDTESPVGPVKSNNPGYSYVNLPKNGQDAHSDNETPPPLVAKKERSR